MIWDKTITADGATATPEQLTKAWTRWVADSAVRKTKNDLAHYLTESGVIGTDKYWPTDRLADRMLQSARKAGEIRYVKGRWELMEAPK